MNRNKLIFLTGAMMLAGALVVTWLITKEIEAISSDLEAMSREDEPDIILPGHDTPDVSNLEPPFNSMSRDWGAGDLDGWWHYEIPEEYKRTGGQLPDLVQVYLYCLCKQAQVDYPMVLALIEVESGYHYDAVSEDGGIGYMQIRYEAHKDRLGDGAEETLKNPYTNIRVGMEYLKELSDRFISKDEVLTAYNYGVTGAYKNFWNDGVYSSPYSDKVLAIRDRIGEDLEKRKYDVFSQVMGVTDGGE